MVFGRRQSWPKLSAADIRKRSKILVIDDQEFPYVKLFRKDGYTIDKWSTVRDLQALERGDYDVILLDLHGVGKAESSEQGLGVLAHIRRRSPAQIVVAYSNAEWSVEYQPFFDAADAILHKTKDDYVAFKATVDELLEKRYSLGFYLEKISHELSEGGASENTMKKVQKAIIQGHPDSLRPYLASRVEEAVTVDRVIAVAQAGASIVQAWKT